MGIRVQEGVELQGCGERCGMAQEHLPGGWILPGGHDGGQNGASLGDWTPPWVKRDRLPGRGCPDVWGHQVFIVGFFFSESLGMWDPSSLTRD